MSVTAYGTREKKGGETHTQTNNTTLHNPYIIFLFLIDTPGVMRVDI